VKRALEKAGIEFLDDDRPGVRVMAKPGGKHWLTISVSQRAGSPGIDDAVGEFNAPEVT